MNILAINTAFKKANVALVGDNDLATAKTYSADAKHSENLLVGIDEILSKEKMQIADLDAVACVVGPGSFTGLRIGVATAKGIMVAFDKIKAIQLSSLELLAFSFFEKNKQVNEVLSIMNGLSDCFFVAVYDRGKGEIIAPKLTTKDEFYDLIKKHKNFACSEDDEMFFHITGEKITDNTFVKFVQKKAKYGELVPENKLLPLYLRLSQAEQDALKKENKNV